MKKYLTFLVFPVAVVALLSVFSCSKAGDKDLFLEIKSPLEIPVGKEGGQEVIDIETNTTWSLTGATTWCYPDAQAGNESRRVNLTVLPNSEHGPRSVVLKVGSILGSANITVTQGGADNVAPTAPALVAPVEGATVLPKPKFEWEASTDANGDAITYVLAISPDGGQTWATYNTKETSYTIDSPAGLDAGDYQWKVTAKDNYGGATESVLRSFTVEEMNVYAEGEYRAAEINRQNQTAVNIVIMGDGFIYEDMARGGAYDQAMDRAREAFFDIEPYRSYRNYFNVYYVYAESRERGATYGWGYDGSTKASFASTVRNTAFNATFSTTANSTATEVNYQKAFDYARKVPAVKQGGDVVLKEDGNVDYSVVGNAIADKNNVINKTVVIVVINDTRYAGTCVMYPTGACVGMVPMSSATDPRMTFEATLRHEVGGHGFGKFTDEYIYSQGSIPETSTDGGYDKKTVKAWQDQLGYYMNVSLTNDKGTAPAIWKLFFSDTDYSNGTYPSVGFFAGACTYGQGIWRAEENTIMNDNVSYFNGPQAYFIYKQIKEIAGETPSWTEFKSKESKRKAEQVNARSVRSRAGDGFIPLAPPVMMDMPQ